MVFFGFKSLLSWILRFPFKPNIKPVLRVTEVPNGHVLDLNLVFRIWLGQIPYLLWSSCGNLKYWFECVTYLKKLMNFYIGCAYRNFFVHGKKMGKMRWTMIIIYTLCATPQFLFTNEPDPSKKYHNSNHFLNQYRCLESITKNG